MKKMLTVLLAVVMLCGLAGIGAVAADSRLAEMQSVVAAYNATHGGTGALAVEEFFESDSGSISCKITGEVRGAKKGIALPNGWYAINWRATLVGETGGEPMITASDGYFWVAGSEIRTNGVAIACSELTGYRSLNVSDSTVVGDIRADDVGIGNGSSFTGAIYAKRVWLSTGSKMNLTALITEDITVSGELRFAKNAAVTISGEKTVYIFTKIRGGKPARALVKDARVRGMSHWEGSEMIGGWIWYNPVSQFILRWVFFPLAMLGF